MGKRRIILHQFCLAYFLTIIECTVVLHCYHFDYFRFSFPWLNVCQKSSGARKRTFGCRKNIFYTCKLEIMLSNSDYHRLFNFLYLYSSFNIIFIQKSNSEINGKTLIFELVRFINFQNDVSRKSSKNVDDKIDLSEGGSESRKHMKSSRQPLPFSMGNVHYMNHIRYHGLNISTTSSSLLVGAIIFTLFSSAFCILVPPPYIPRLQLHRVC